MISKKEKMTSIIKQKVRDGNGAIHFTNAFEQEEMFGKARLCAVLEFEPGASIGVHPHDPEAELCFVLDGEFTITENGVTKVLKPGEASFTGGGEIHCVSNDTDRPAKMLAVVMN